VDFTGFPDLNPGNADAVNEFNELNDVILAQMDALVDPYTPPPAAPPDDGNDLTLSTLDTNLGVMNAVDLDTDPTTGDAQLQALGEQLLPIYAEIPGEAFQPVPASLLTQPGLEPTGQVATPVISISNLTRPGDTNFYPGDQYQLNIQLAPAQGGGGTIAGVDVQMYPVLDNNTFDPVDLCLTDQYGVLTAVGTFQLADVGDWTIYFDFFPTAAQQAANPYQPEIAGELQFTVQPSSAGGTPPTGSSVVLGGGLHPTVTEGQPCPNAAPITATLANTTRPGAAGYFSGDAWLLTITGPPSQDVLMSALFNNAPEPWVVIGQTDANGNFTLTGTFADEYLGTWVENVQVGSIVWQGNLSFTVSPAQST
jgi:hypothetical protein